VWSETDDVWRERRAERNAGRLAIYEVHARAWRHHDDGRPLSYRELAEPLADHVAGLGFTHVEFMPLASHPFGGSWGYQLTGYYAPDARGGTPDDVRFLIDALHQRGIGVIVDWVPAHFARDEGALARFDGTALYEHADPMRGEHPDWGTLVFNHGRHEVRNFLVANALFWLEEYRLDGLRVDAVASMLYLDYSRDPGQWVPNALGGREDLEAIDFIRSLNRSVAADHPGALMIAEESTAWPGVTRSSADGGLGFTHKQNLGWMHDTLDYLVRDPIHRKWHHHDLLRPFVYAGDEHWVLPLSHDEFVHGKGSWVTRFPGDRWQQLATLRTLLAWQWFSPGSPMVFMGAELAEDREFDEQRPLDWHLADDPAHGGTGRLLACLNRVAVEFPALWRDDDDSSSWSWLDADDHEHSLLAFIRRETHPHGTVLVGVANFTPVPLEAYRVGLPDAGRWRSVLDTDAVEFGGSGYALRGRITMADVDIPWQGQPFSGVIPVPPLAITLYAVES
jgi:1,4-alpha-glucan branching enzyme